MRSLYRCLYRKRLWLLPLALGLCGASLAAPTNDFAAGVQVGQIKESNLAELSGIVASRGNPGVLWVHNDRARGDVYAVSTDGLLLATWSLAQDVSDFEDIAFGPGPMPELQYIYCGDIGDNAATRPEIRVYRAAEPAVYRYQSAHPPSQNFPSVEKFTLLYPDGSHNAEALLVDPWTGDLFIATKGPFRARIYKAESAQLRADATITLSLVGDLEFDVVSAGDISPDGREILLRQEDFARIWRREPGQTVAQALESVPIEVPVIGRPTEPNGEGVGYAADGRGYYAVSEGTDPILYFFQRLAPPTAPGPEVLLPPASVWKYQDDGSDQGAAWRNPSFNDSAWSSGPGQFGYGENDEQTTIKYGSDKDRKRVTTYFRATFEVADPGAWQSLLIRVVFDDGAAVYLNGTEVLRRNLSDQALFSDAALAAAGANENLWQTFSVSNLLRSGANTIAVEVHRHSRSEADLSFDLQLLGVPGTSVLQFGGPPRRLSEEAWALDIESDANGTVTIETSADLLHWSAAASLSLTNRVGSATVPASPASQRFYRLRQ